MKQFLLDPITESVQLWMSISLAKEIEMNPVDFINFQILFKNQDIKLSGFSKLQWTMHFRLQHLIQS